MSPPGQDGSDGEASMESFTIANLEAKLGCLEPGFLISSPRKDYACSDAIFEPPQAATSRLDSPPKDKTVYVFGDDGNIAWVTPAGELLAVVSRVGNKLAGIEYKKAIENGMDYASRSETFAKALESLPGKGFGLGLSLDMDLDAVDYCWVDHRWPRFKYSHESLDIHLQYYIDSGSIIQQYQVHNKGEEEARVPVIISSDLCFIGHDEQIASVRPVPTHETSQRQVLFGNTEVLVIDDFSEVQARFAAFHNGEKVSLWTDQPSKDDGYSDTKKSRSRDLDDELRRAEGDLEDRIKKRRGLPASDFYSFRSLFDRAYGTENNWKKSQREGRRNFAQHSDTLIVPPSSTQELCLTVHIADFLRPEINKTDVVVEKPMPPSERQDLLSESDDKDEQVIAAFVSPCAGARNHSHRRHVVDIVKLHAWLGAAYEKIGWIGEARFHHYSAFLFVETIQMDDVVLAAKTTFDYARFLDDNGWRSTAFEVLDATRQLLSSIHPHSLEQTTLWLDVLRRLALMHFEEEHFSQAEILYETLRAHHGTDEVNHNLDAARLVERIAYTQACQRKFHDAETNYALLSPDLPMQQGTVLSNIAFLKRRQGFLDEAESLYQRALNCLRTGEMDSNAELVETNRQITTSRSDSAQSHYSDKGVYSMCRRILDNTRNCIAHLYVYSRFGTEIKYTTIELSILGGIFKCLCTGKFANYERHSTVSANLVGYIDVNSFLAALVPRTLPFKDCAFHFALNRHFETLVNVCSIPIKAKDGSTAIAFVDADPMGCTYDSRGSYFQFKFLVQCQRYIVSFQKDDEARPHYSERIHALCRGYLVWVSDIANSANTWSCRYAIDGTSKEELEEGSSMSRASDTSSQFLKLCLYYHTWTNEWGFVLSFLHQKMGNWLQYLESAIHMDNLWVENEDLETFKPLDTSGGDGDYVSKTYPHYKISESATVWLALQQVENMIQSIEREINSEALTSSDKATIMIGEVRKCFTLHQDALNLHRLRSRIFETFKYPREGADVPTIPVDRALNGQLAATSSIHASFRHYDFGQTSASRTANWDAGASSEHQRQFLLLRRKLKVDNDAQYISTTDSLTIEAARAGLFEGSSDSIAAAWRETLRLQKRRDISTIKDTLVLGLILLASRYRVDLAGAVHGKTEEATLEKISIGVHKSGLLAQSVTDEGLKSKYWGTVVTYAAMSDVLGSLIEKCRELLPADNEGVERRKPPNAFSLLMSRHSSQSRIAVAIPGQVDPFSRSSQSDINVFGFLPDWMYYYPNFIHKNVLDINVREQIKELSSVKSLEFAISKWQENKNFASEEKWRIPFEPGLIDSGRKNRKNLTETSNGRQMKIQSYYDRDELLKCLLEPRLPTMAKKRLIEISSYDKEGLLICWLACPEEERPLFMEFYRRHDLYENFFSERASFLGDMWDTEFHLGFFQLLEYKDAENLIVLNSLRKSLSDEASMDAPATLHGHKVVPVALSFRIVGDLRDRLWTCHFLSSTSYGFESVVEEYYRTDATYDDIYADKQGQRKLLETFYVERALNEMRQSIQKILTEFKKELEVTEIKHNQKENYELIHDQSSPPLKAGAVLGDVLQQLESSLGVIEQWEKREDTRGLRSRWSPKDQQRHGDKLKASTLKCKSHVHQLRVQQSRLREQRRNAEQRHNNLMSYKQLQEARTSTRSAADVRLFTYVTIIFLPLSFSSSLFSMGVVPDGNTIYVMVPTTIIALMITFLVLANMKVMDRHWSTWVQKLHKGTRNKMKAKSQSEHWHKISSELEFTTQRRLVKEDIDEQLPAESQWHYTRFWLMKAISSPWYYVRHGIEAKQAYHDKRINGLVLFLSLFAAFILAPIAAMIFLVVQIITTAFDAVHLVLVMTRWLAKKMLDTPTPIPEPVSKSDDEPDIDGQDSQKASDLDNTETPAWIGTNKSTEQSIWISTNTDTVLTWLENPPRPFQSLAKRIQVDKKRTQTSEPNPPEIDRSVKSMTDTIYQNSWAPSVLLARMLTACQRHRPARSASPTESKFGNREAKDGKDGNEIGQVLTTHVDELDFADVDGTTENATGLAGRRRSMLGRSRRSVDDVEEPRSWVGWLV